MGKRQSPSTDWRGRWNNIDLNLRAQYKDYEAYKAAYQKSDKKQNLYQEDGMEAFAKLEKSLLRRARYASYIQQSSVSPHHIKCEDYKLSRLSLAGFLFGSTTRIDHAQLRSTILDSLHIHDPLARPRKVVLVGHGITHTEPSLLELLDISLENDLPNVVGIVDTERLSKTLQNCTGSLGQLLKRLQIGFPQRSLHCAGNDACFALKAMIGLLQLRHPGLLDELDELKLLPPVTAQLESSEREDSENSDDWLNNLDGDYCSILD